MLINRNFRRLWLGQAISLVGDYVFDTTLLLWIATILLKDNSWAPLASGAVLIVASLAMLLAAPIAGVMVDRWRDKRRIMMRADLIRAVLIGFLTLLASLPSGTVSTPVLLTVIGLVVAGTTATSQFFNPARFVLIGDVVPADQRGRATGYSQATGATAIILGPPLAAPLLIGLGPQWSLAVNAASFVVSYFLIRSVSSPAHPEPDRPAEAHRPGVAREFTDGLRYMAANRVLRTILVTALVTMFGLGGYFALDVYFVDANLHADPKVWFGFLGAAFGAGMLTGSLAGGHIGDRFGHTYVLGGGCVAFGLSFLVYSQLTSIVPGLITVAVMSFSLAVLNTAAAPLILSVTPREIQARVLTAINMANRLPELASMLLATIAVTTILKGQYSTVYLAGSLLIAVAGIYALVALRPIALAASPTRRPLAPTPTAPTASAAPALASSTATATAAPALAAPAPALAASASAASTSSGPDTVPLPRHLGPTPAEVPVHPAP